MPTSLGQILEIQHLRLRYPRSNDWSINNLNLCIRPGERLALIGPSGCGKSSVAKSILHLLPKGSRCEGKLLLTGKDPRILPQAELRKLRGKAAGLIFQDPMTRLNPLLTVGGHLLDTLKAHPREFNSIERKQRAEELLEKVGLSTSRFKAYPHELSGGMRQRLAIALAISLNPPLIIADEPTTSLDVAIAEQIMSELSILCSELNSSLMLITHDIAIASKWCERIAILDKGTIVEEGTTQQILTTPKSNVGQRILNAAKEREGEQRVKQEPKSIILKVENLRCWHALNGWPWKTNWLKAVNGISFQLHKGESLGIVGLSGCGKSTLCRSLIGLTKIRGGQIHMQGHNLLTLKGNQLIKIRRLLQLVFQDPLACLNPKMTILEAVIDPLLIHKLANKVDARRIANNLLEEVGLSPVKNFQHRFPRELSGGQQQRVAIARALATKPKVLICDESVSMLDAETQTEILSLLNSLQQKFGLSIILITHDITIAKGFCHRLIILNKGKIIEEGSIEKIFSSPTKEITKRLIYSSPKIT